MTHTARAREPLGPAVAPTVDRAPETTSRYIEDAAHFPGGRADGVARPATEGAVAALVRASHRLLVAGAQSSLTGGATPAGDVVLSTERLTTIEAAGPSLVRAGAGVTLDALQAWLVARGRWYPPVPTFTGATAGGVVSTNAAGASTFKYGTTRAWVEGLTVVLACGHVLDISRGQVSADPVSGFRIDCACGTRDVRPGRYAMPDVPKCSAGYFAAPDMDLVDLFVGAEGTLGVIVDATFRTLPVRPAVAMALVPVPTEARAVALTGALRRGAQQAWQTRDPAGLDVAAVEQVDRRCLELLHEDGVDARCHVSVPDGTALVLFVHVELPAGTTAARAYDEVASALLPSAADAPLVRLCRLLADHDVLPRTEMAMPGEERRAAEYLAFREGAPSAVNRRVALAKQRTGDDRIQKTAADMIVPFDRLAEALATYRDGYRRRGLDYAIWGHTSDANVHPNVIPRSYDDVKAGHDAILEFGRAVKALGGCPLAEHGVGRSPLKQALLRDFHGTAALDDMRAVKRALDPEGRLARGVLIGDDGTQP